MAFTYKSISSSGTSGGGGGGSSTPYVQAFSSVDWVSSGGSYKITILESTHEKGTNYQVKVYETVGATFEEVGVGVTINSSGDAIISVTEIPDNRFTGKIIIL